MTRGSILEYTKAVRGRHGTAVAGALRATREACLRAPFLSEPLPIGQEDCPGFMEVVTRCPTVVTALEALNRIYRLILTQHGI
ncbi:hypothetical protein ACFLYG_01920 [Chloroflexota bacterium]